MSVLAIDTSNNRSAQAPLTVTTIDGTPPTVPQNLTEKFISANKGMLTWTPSTDNVGVTGYNVYLNNVFVKTVPRAETEFLNLTQLTSYKVRVQAVDAAKNRSGLSQELTFTTKDGIAPSAPTLVTTSQVTKRGFLVSWTASTDNIGVGGYHIYRNGVYANTVKNGATSFQFSNLDFNSSHQISVQAFDLAGNRSTQSTAITVATTYTPDWTAPETVTNIRTNFTTQTSINLIWNATTDNVAVTHYHIFRNGKYLMTVNGLVNSYHVRLLTPNTTYQFTIVAQDAEQNKSQASAAFTVKTKP